MKVIFIHILLTLSILFNHSLLSVDGKSTSPLYALAIASVLKTLSQRLNRPNLQPFPVQSPRYFGAGHQHQHHHQQQQQQQSQQHLALHSEPPGKEIHHHHYHIKENNYFLDKQFSDNLGGDGFSDTFASSDGFDQSEVDVKSSFPVSGDSLKSGEWFGKESSSGGF